MAEDERRIDTARTLGEHSARLELLADDVTEIKGDIKTLLADKNQSEGSRKTIYTIAAVLGSMGGLAATYAAKLFK